MGVGRELIRFGYLFVLDREPESEDAFSAHCDLPDLRTLRHTLLSSDEGQSLLRSTLAQSNEPAADRFERRTVCHIHLEKTGGTSLHKMLADHFDPAHVSPPHLQSLNGMSLAEISRFDLISAHFDYRNSLLLPRRTVQRVCLFRDPCERLWSFYRFHRSHPTKDTANSLVSLAHEVEPDCFFRHPAVRSSPRLNNAYLRVFGTTLDHPVEPDEEAPTAEAIARACTRIRSLEGIGLTDRMAESTTLIFEALNLPAPSSVLALHRTDDFRNDRVPEMSIPSGFRQAVAPLIRFDELLFDVAVAEFACRLKAADAAGVVSTDRPQAE